MATIKLTDLRPEADLNETATLDRWGVRRCDAVDRVAFDAGLGSLIEVEAPADEPAPRRLDRLYAEQGETVRQLLQDAVSLARTGERAHRTDDLWPHGILDELDDLVEELEAHEAHEDFVRSEAGEPSVPLLSGLREDHAVLATRLQELRRLTGGFEAPAHACAVWRLLYVLCLKVEMALVERMTLEDSGIPIADPQSYGGVSLSPSKERADPPA